MRNYFIVYYDKAIVDLYYNDEKFTFDLKEGDVGDYWDSLTTKDGVIRDVNFYQDTPDCMPSFATYGISVDGYTNTSDEEPIKCKGMQGNVNNYFNL